MPVLTNFADQCDLVNLGSASDGRGPYFMRQSGYSPTSTTFKQDVFYLRKDGTWVINFAALSLSENDIRDRFIFSSAGDIAVLLDEIGAKPTAAEDQLPADKTPEQISAILESTASKLISRIRSSNA
ncbi:hypothetical protein BH11VER1_BH11VER1_16150 [soil metagenome]